VAVLGADRDLVIAKKLGRNPSAVSQQRAALRVARFRAAHS
jgi:hypothetical protein